MRISAWLRAAVPVQPFARALLLRGALLWAGVRCILLFVDPSHESLFPSVRAILLILVTVGVLAMLDARRRNEILFLGNLGVSQRTIALLSIVPGAVLELGVALFGQVGPRL